MRPRDPTVVICAAWRASRTAARGAALPRYADTLLRGTSRSDLLLASRSGPLGRTERDPRTHGLLLYRCRGTPKLLGDLTCRGS